jgi:hypothetical protein
MKRVQEQVSKAQEAQPQIAESLPQNGVTIKDKQQDTDEQRSYKSADTVEQEESKEEERGEGDDSDYYQQPNMSPISVKQEQKHDESVDQQYHHMRSLIELLSSVDYIKEKDSNLVLVDKTKEHRFKLVKQLSDLVKTIYTDGRTLSLILNDYLKQLDKRIRC